MNRSFALAVLWYVFGPAAHAGAADSRFCDPNVDCTPNRTCVRRSDDRDCSALNASPCVLEKDSRSCDPPFDCPSQCPWFDVSCVATKSACEMNKQAYRASCESTKAAQHAVAINRHMECEKAWKAGPQGQDAAGKVERCEAENAAQNKLFDSQYGACQSELEIQRLDCEKNKELQRRACESGERGPFACDPAGTMRALRAAPFPYVDRTLQRAERLSTTDVPHDKEWLDTACDAKGTGVPQHDAVLSTDGFWTIELKLDAFSIGDTQKPAGNRFLRLVIRPRKWGGGKAHDLAGIRYITRRDRISFAGRAVIDRASPVTLEVHPVDNLEILEANPQP